MSSLMDLYSEVYGRIRELAGQITEASDKIDAINERRLEDIPLRIENLKNQLKKIDEYQLKIEGFRQLAEKSLTSKNLATIEAPEGYRVNLNRLHKWSMMIDPMSTNDPYAQRVYLVANCDLVFLAQKKVEFEARIVELEKDKDTGATVQIKTLEQEIAALRETLANYVNGPEMEKLGQKLRKAHKGYIYVDAPKEYASAEDSLRGLSIGAVGKDFDIFLEDKSTLPSLFGDFFDEKKNQIFVPMEAISVDREFAMTVSCVPARTRLNEMDAGIRNMLFHMIDKCPAGSREVYVIDALRQNSTLIGGLKALEGSCALHAIPKNEEQLVSAVEEIVSSFADIDEVLEHHDTVAEYNQSVEPSKAIPRKLVVLVGWPNAFEGETANCIRKIMTNYERYGISFVAVRVGTKAEEAKFGLSEYVGESVIKITMGVSDNQISIGNEAPQNFMWYTFKHVVSSKYKESLDKLKVTESTLGNEYIKRVDIENIPAYTRKYKKIELPYGVDSKDVVHNVAFENENFATYLVGASRSGKSTLLHTLIAGLIRDYHPDNLELWLADFKQLEFKNYIDHLPPHVKYVLLDESRELVFDLIDKLTERMNERQHLFGKLNVKRIDQVDFTALKEPMPVIFVILDEFSIMSQAVSESEVYKIKLQNLLAKGAALGIRFLFASQTFTKGIAGLTATAKDQIQQRISMKASREEIDATLELSSSLRTDQVKMWMDALPVHYALTKQWKKDGTQEVRRVHVLYFKDYDVRDRMIDKLREEVFQKVETYDPSDIHTYVDKKPVLVDGNSYQALDMPRILAYVDGLKANTTDYNGDELFAVLGAPRLMAEMKPVVITPESRQNLLLVADASEQVCAASVIQSVMKCAQAQDVETEIWAFDRNKIYRNYKDVLWQEESIADTMDEICLRIHELRQQVEAKQVEENKLVVLLGFESVCPDFALMGSWKANQTEGASKTKQSTEHQQEESLSAGLGSLKDFMSGNSNTGFATMLAKANPLPFLSKPMPQKEEESLLTEVTSSVIETEEEENAEEKVETKAEEKAVASAKEQTEDIYAYNALSDLQYLVKQASRQGVHFLVCVNSQADLKQTGLSVDFFKHRMLFKMSADESRLLINHKAAGELPEHVCVYTDLMERYSFRPYLHAGLSWNGWEVDKNGKAKNQFE